MEWWKDGRVRKVRKVCKVKRFIRFVKLAGFGKLEGWDVGINRKQKTRGPRPGKPIGARYIIPPFKGKNLIIDDWFYPGRSFQFKNNHLGS
jgi:hypothetical protein